MKPLKYLESLEKRIRGWLPKEPTLPGHQRTRKTANSFPYPRLKWHTVTGIVILILVMSVIKVLFPEALISISSIIAPVFGILLGAYLISRVRKKSETLALRVVWDLGGSFFGMLTWFIIISLDLVFHFSGGVLGGIIVLLLLPVLMAIGAVIMDGVGKQRNYTPFMEGGGNI
jgi:purine-cytosine permease-like protein